MEPFQTEHKVIWTNAAKMKGVQSESVDLVVTSPPYPMIEMWDPILAQQGVTIKNALNKGGNVPCLKTGPVCLY